MRRKSHMGASRKREQRLPQRVCLVPHQRSCLRINICGSCQSVKTSLFTRLCCCCSQGEKNDRLSFFFPYRKLTGLMCRMSAPELFHPSQIPTHLWAVTATSDPWFDEHENLQNVN